MTIYKPYTYLIGWSSQQKFYYGVRFAKNCNPSDLWIKYFTSSRLVAKYRVLYGEPDIIQIRKTFSDKNSAVLWEEKVLRKLDIKNNEKMINMNVAGAITKNNHLGGAKKGNVPWNKGKTGIYSTETKQKISKARIGKPTTKGQQNPLSANNGKVGASKQSATVTGRKRKYLPDGKWVWGG